MSQLHNTSIGLVSSPLNLILTTKTVGKTQSHTPEKNLLITKISQTRKLVDREKKGYRVIILLLFNMNGVEKKSVAIN